MDLRSPSTVHMHLRALEEAGYLERSGRKTRALSITGTSSVAVPRVPILGQVTAGMPILAVEQVEGYVPYDGADSYHKYFALRIKGDSMIGAGILDGDLIVVQQAETARSGQIIVALIEDEATCKRLKQQKDQIWLMPENPAYEPIDGNGCSILGIVKAVYRQNVN